MGSLSARENREIEAANVSGTTPVVFIHGLWLLPSSWARWADFFKQAGYAPLTPDWPDDPETVEEARANPDVLAKKTLKQVADHTADVIGKLEKKPAVMGHSTGGLFAQMLAGRGLSAATVAIDPGVFRGVLPLPLSTLRAAGPFLLNPRYRGRAITLTFDQGTDPDIAQVQVQNKLQLATPLLPPQVQQSGIRVTKSSASFLLVAGFVSSDKHMTKFDIADYVVSHVQDPVSRLDGVGNITVFGTQYAMRVWMDANAKQFALTPLDVTSARRVRTCRSRAASAHAGARLQRLRQSRRRRCCERRMNRRHLIK